eukprot:scaffold65755_cov61-Phaeocystis_antarctica.AAC.3
MVRVRVSVRVSVRVRVRVRVRARVRVGAKVRDRVRSKSACCAPLVVSPGKSRSARGAMRCVKAASTVALLVTTAMSSCGLWARKVRAAVVASDRKCSSCRPPG